MTGYSFRPNIVMADDDPDDFSLTLAALEENGVPIDLHRVSDGEELLGYLSDEQNPTPTLILLDLNMPIKDGKQALSIIKGDPNFKQIPVVVYSSSTAAEDILRSYQLGASTYIPKPASFQSLVQTMKSLCTYWLDTAALPFSEAGVHAAEVQATA